MKKILVILDGASGLPEDCFGGKSVLDVAETPNLDYFAKHGKMGYMHVINEKHVPGSGEAVVSLFGNNPLFFKRGVAEALGLGIKLKRGDFAVRVNLGTIENLRNRKIIDRRAGRTLTTKEAKILADSLNKDIKLPCKFEFYSGVQHRGVLVLRGGFSDNISNIDPEYSNGKSLRFEFSKPFDDEDEIAKYTSNVLNDFITQAHNVLKDHPVNIERKRKGLLPANILFTRGGGVEIPKLKKYRTWMSINSYPLEIGLSRLFGMTPFSFQYPKLKKIDVYDNLYDSLNKSIKFATKIIKKQHKNFNGCYIHFKETDVPGHDNKPYEKKNMLEMIDKRFFGYLRKFIMKKNLKIVVTCDHSTPCKLKGHSADPVPVLVFDKNKEDDTIKFCEREARKGSLGEMYGKNFMKKTGLEG
jgi:2,3-bisphosphoglycerate-independent phosphoglycerate mutase